jgi:hypothetical protein
MPVTKNESLPKGKEPPAPVIASALDDVMKAREKREELAKRLAQQDLLVGHLVRVAKKAGATWQQIGDAGNMSDVAALKASRRREHE